MQIPPFKLERYFARWEFDAPYLLCSSDIEGYGLGELLALADGETRALWDGLALGYTEAPGHPLLRAEIAGLYAGVRPEQVYTFAGAEEAIFALMHALLGPGDHAVVTWPGYQSLYELARAAGADLTLLPLDADAGWRLDLDQLRAALRPNTRLIVVNAPHNPTGALPDAATFRELVQIADAAGATLLSDEVYRLLEYEPADRLPAAVELSERAVSLGVMSKAFGLAGLRVGWLATRDAALLGRVAAFKDYLSICNSAPSEILALAALRAREAVLERSHAILRPNLALLDRFFAEWAHVLDWTRPRAGSIGFPRLRIGRSIAQVADELREQEGVLILPATVYDYPGDYFRLGFGRRNMPEALERMGRYLGRHA
ncbi:MAG TPA: aminotransferase class I/II-fold pyridoxal phosphate-dependent enzyme [Roseiflexaceae bacterium]|nr:aminotransferase class I/II-fold pyridoxal phosphate-dependent enzyme [Roseiflexaceae bacterium]